MVFSSIIFIFVFLPAVLLINWILSLNRHIFLRNIALFMASILFYTWGEAYYALIILASIIFNYLWGLLLNQVKNKQRLILGLGIGINVLFLFYYKYFNFLIENINSILKILDLPLLANSPIHLPIGISFFTFQSISYLIDVYRGQATVQKNPFTVGLYIAMFPQLIAGPIVRYQTVAERLGKRSVKFDDYLTGARMFIVGLAKKVIIADTMAAIADSIAKFKAVDINTPLAWLFVISYSLQIFFDFAGYSDMAKGLGRIFGFEFLDNFNQPYTARSVREFWQRWHISLSTWFRDYVYIPLGGNRISPIRTHINLLIVFFLAGIWHGASWNFVFWGLFHGTFLILERQRRIKTLLDRTPWFLKNLYLLLVVMTAWVFFRLDSFKEASRLVFHLFVPYFPSPSRPNMLAVYYLDSWIILVMTAGIVFSLIRWDSLKKSWGLLREKIVCTCLECLVMLSLFLFSLASVIAKSYSPFIYFRF